MHLMELYIGNEKETLTNNQCVKVKTKASKNEEYTHCTAFQEIALANNYQHKQIPCVICIMVYQKPCKGDKSITQHLPIIIFHCTPGCT